MKLLVFGLVKDLSNAGEDLTQTGIFMGSPKYMAPEQITAGAITAKTDIYALGCMLYEMLVGKPPFERGAPMATLVAHVNEAPPAMSARNPEAAVSPTFEALVLRRLEKQPDKRFASMRTCSARSSARRATRPGRPLTASRAYASRPRGLASRRSAPEDSGRSLMSAAASSLAPPASAAPAAAPARGSGLRLAIVVLAASLASGAPARRWCSRGRPRRRPRRAAWRSPRAPCPSRCRPPRSPSRRRTQRRVFASCASRASYRARASSIAAPRCTATPCEIACGGEGAKIRRELTLSKAAS